MGRKLVSIVGVRPNLVKLAALIEELPKNFRHIIIHTGQHYDYELSKAFFDCFELPDPHYNLEVGSGTYGYQVGEMTKRIETVLMKEKPDMVIVYGDANSTLAGALAATMVHTKIAHVEAGYRSYDKSMPEEVNRVLTDQISDLLFAPTKTTLQNLKKENVQGKTFLTGDVMADVLLNYLRFVDEKSNIIKKLDISPKNYIVLTLHRKKNTEHIDRTASIIKALLSLKEFNFVFPIHPRTRMALQKFGLYKKVKRSKNIKIIPPLNYLDFVNLEKNASKIVTDSGGVQKEAYILGIPCITLRDSTECVETIQEGWNMLVGSNTEKIINTVRNFNPKSSLPRHALGKGDAAIKIIKIIEKEFD